MPVLAVIPARLGSTRLPNKPLRLLGGQPLVVRVAQRVAGMGCVDRVVVATDAEQVVQVVRAAGFEVVLTSAGHQSGTDRVAEVASFRQFSGYDIVVNVQGDEPFLPEEAVAGAVGQVREGQDIGTASVPLDPGHAGQPDRVKVVTDRLGRALYFSRAAIPFRRDAAELQQGAGFRQHLGIYAYRRQVLERLGAMAPTSLELAEKLEQLRALENGLTIGVARLDEPAMPGIDTIEDLRLAEAHWHATFGGEQ